jgi:arsenate reductase (thioredoxin)
MGQPKVSSKQNEPGSGESMPSTLLFLCPHNAAKSVIAAACFNQQAAASGLAWTAISAGTEPAAHVSSVVVQLLLSYGLDASGHQPRPVTYDDLATADRVISLGCAPASLPARVGIEHWNDVPLPSQNVHDAYAVIQTHVHQLVTNLKARR